jgi:DNA-binding PadR family transcriptional regulator
VPELTNVSYLVLGLIERAGAATPYELKQMAATVSGLWTLRHDQVYREPVRLAQMGLLEERREEHGRRRRVFSITASGSSALRQWLERPTGEFTELRDAGLLQLFLGGEPKDVAARQLEAHEQRLAEYEELHAAMPVETPEGVRLSLEAGIGHEREWVRFWRRLARGRA